MVAASLHRDRGPLFSSRPKRASGGTAATLNGAGHSPMVRSPLMSQVPNRGRIFVTPTARGQVVVLGRRSNRINVAVGDRVLAELTNAPCG
jgi:hypothetical protein